MICVINHLLNLRETLLPGWVYHTEYTECTDFFGFRRQYEQYRQFIDVDKTKQIVKMKLLFSLSVLSSKKEIFPNL